MLETLPEHYSHNYQIDIDQKPAKASDRISPFICFYGIVFGLILVLLGLFDQIPEIHGTNNTSIFMDAGVVSGVPEAQSVPNYSRDFFDFFFIFIGIVVILPLAIAHLRYKKIIINEDSVFIIKRRARGRKEKTSIDLSEYEGVRLRTEISQYGLLQKIKHIIELAHKNEEYTIPLYITTKAKDIRNKWEEYAKKLNLPAVVITHMGIEKRAVKDLDKSIGELVREKKIKDNYNADKTVPEGITYIKQSDKLIVKPTKIYWDLYSFLISVFIFLVLLLTITSVAFHSYIKSVAGMTWLVNGYMIEILAIIIPLMMLFKRQKLVIKLDKVVAIDKWPLGLEGKVKLPKEHIEAVDIVYDHKKEQPYISISSDDKAAHFGKKLPIETLQWVREFLIHYLAR